MKEIKKLKNNRFARTFSVAKLALKSGTNLLFSKENDLKNILKDSLQGHVEDIAHEFNMMKGGLMKAGQLLSSYAGGFLPPEAQKILQSLEQDSYFLEWSSIKKSIPPSWFEKLAIEEMPLAAASLGQVHLAKLKDKTSPSFRKLAMKIQYEGVGKAIDNDIRALKMLLSSMKILPKDTDYQEVFEEIKQMLVQETNYTKEAEQTIKFKDLLATSPQYYVPEIYPEFSNQKIVTTEFIKGINLRSDLIKALPQERKNKLGESFYNLFLKEIFELGVMQTDPNFGNFLVMPMEDGFEFDRWGLIDFGATKVLNKKIGETYKSLIISCADRDRDLFFATLHGLGIFSDKKETNENLLWEYCLLLGAPYQSSSFDFGNSDTPDKVFQMLPRLFKEIHIAKPPKDGIFIDRKIVGMFFILKELGAIIDLKKILDNYR